jgi:dihydrolipoamide dehydrogenase
MDQILPGSDSEVTAIVSSELNRQKMRIHTGTRITDPRRKADQLLMTFEKNGGEAFEDRFDAVLLSVGRIPNTQDLWMSESPLKTDSRGFIAVDDKLQTTVSGIFACGDVIGGDLLAHKASHQAIQIVDLITGGRPGRKVPVPAAVFTIPEVAAVGITEDEAQKMGIEYRVGRFPYAAGSRSNAEGDKSGLVKIISNPDGRILGGHIVGTGAAELIQVINLAMCRDLLVGDFQELVTVHPTFSENVTEALGDLGGFSIHT